MQNFRKGQAIKYDVNDIYEAYGYGVVISIVEDIVYYVDVNPITEITKCYDDIGAEYDKHKDNVRLKHCPPPFSEMLRGCTRGIYAVADVKHPKKFTEEQCREFHVTVIDDGVTISDEDMQEILNHPWPHQLEKEKRYRPLPTVAQYMEDEPEKDDEFSL